ncbi:MAG: 16S rRNA (guanine(966)-N(2))-methyltransferase RsmD [Thermodesulfobacteriota bacterium]
MRIISGRSRGRKLLTPKEIRGKEPLIRPTSDRAREALFNIIGPQIVGAKILDLFAGTGAFGLEALSRGAVQAVFVDDSQYACSLIAENCQLCHEEEGVYILRRNLLKSPTFLKKMAEDRPFDLIFMDPPYGKGFIRNLLYFFGKTASILTDHGMLIVEEVYDADLPRESQGLILQDCRTYGKTGFWFYQKGLEENE